MSKNCFEFISGSRESEILSETVALNVPDLREHSLGKRTETFCVAVVAVYGISNLVLCIVI